MTEKSETPEPDAAAPEEGTVIQNPASDNAQSQNAANDGQPALKIESSDATVSESPATKKSLRRSRWVTSWAAIQYISTLADRDLIKTRQSDRNTNILLICTALAAIGMILWPQGAPFLRIVCDLLIGGVLLFYMSNRFGIITTLNPRQALLIWELMVAGILSGMFILCNLQFIVDALLEYFNSLSSH